MRLRRVLMTADAVGGVWSYALNLARGLAGRGVAVTLAVMGRAPSTGQRQAASLVPGLTLLAAPWKLEWEQGCEADLGRAAKWLLGLERRFAPDLVHVNGFWAASLPWRAPRILVAHSCVNTWWRAVHAAPPPAEWHAYTARVRDGLAAADIVVAPTEAFLDELTLAHGRLPNARAIWNGCDGGERASAKSAWVLAAGRAWDPAKNIEAAAAAAARLPWPVLIAGEGGRSAPAPNVRRLGLLEPREMAAMFERSAIFVSPARYEPFGLGPLEAALAGCALVLGDIPTLRELWNDAALFVRPDDAAGLERAIRGLIVEPRRRLRFAEAARRRAARYSVERMTNAYLDAYAEALGEAAPLQRAS